MKQKKILVACGTGIATSTVVVKKLKTLLDQHGAAANVQQCKVSELDSKLDDVDLIITTTPYKNTINDVPVVVAISFLTGVGIENDINKIVEIISKDHKDN
ncbi:PTS sugar transporter subunit IIB [Maledivibacter halophilus]|uniref:PTS system, galactitol-specific IIB component n=1 Tax=Maledivibacter halophilus TaxID=36842 RepID=A0A1T5MI58_9FIRM|nr:PTS sugar transporter subunit IIB [Maledivibacter halophilus]SKC87917.1 PTS system, galactitol-specific IIB component [Maledivibacter halophilus]